MFDLVHLTLRAGNGGHGRVAFHREKFMTKGGPDGGRGGDGGNIYLEADASLNTLQHFSGVKEFVAQSGQNGGGSQRIGRRGNDVILKVPVGTIVWLLAENHTASIWRRHIPRERQQTPEIHLERYRVEHPRATGIPPREPDLPMPFSARTLSGMTAEAAERSVQRASAGENLTEEDGEASQVFRSTSLTNLDLTRVPKIKLVELSHDGETVLLCHGGKGGLGNESFKSAANTTPLEAEYGGYGEQKIVMFELRLVADVGLIGLPNAGKSTLLSVITHAHPKIANYPFTTKTPNLGVLHLEFGPGQGGARDLVVADLPGLIEGASQGKGLGFTFLRHAQSCRVLLFVLAIGENEIYNSASSEEEKAQLFYDQFVALRQELTTYGQNLPDKPFLIGIAKSELLAPELRQAITTIFARQGLTPHFFSSLTQEGMTKLTQEIAHVIDKK